MALINTTTTGVLGSTFFGDGAGDLTVQKDGVTVNKITSAPAFRAYKSSGSQSITTSTFTKLTFQTTDFNTGSCFDTSTSKFTPTVAGYYNLTAAFGVEGSGSIGRMLILFYKNGAAIGNYLQDIQWGSGTAIAGQGFVITGTDLIYFNGTTDYLETYCYIGGTSIIAVNTHTRFSGFLARVA